MVLRWVVSTVELLDDMTVGLKGGWVLNWVDVMADKKVQKMDARMAFFLAVESVEQMVHMKGDQKDGRSVVLKVGKLAGWLVSLVVA